MNRRDIIRAAWTAAVFGPPLLAACSRKDDALQKLWAEWQKSWRRMQAIARQRGWNVTPLRIAPPATALEIAALEARHGMPVPAQLREVLTAFSREVTFGWDIPQHLRPMERVEHHYATSGGIRGAIWSYEQIDQYAIANFLDWKRDLADADLREAENMPEMWNNQFAFGHLINGDMLTIDVTNPDPPRQPVRYFSHEVEGLHAFEIAPNFLAFISVWSALGCAGQEQSDWFRFIPSHDKANRVAHLDATGDGAKTWFAWRDGGVVDRHPDHPPPAIVETTAADRALLDAARANSLAGVKAALLAGAKPDCVPSSEWQIDTGAWQQEFHTAINYATRHNNTTMVEALLEAGATLNTRLLPLNVAAKESSLDTVRWLIAKGARVDGWKDQRYWPLHDLVVTRGRIAAMTKDAYAVELKKKGWPTEPAAIADQLARHIDKPTYLAMLEALLAAGAKPDAPWDNGITMLAWAGDEASEVLLKHGASVHQRDHHGWTPFFRARTAVKIRLLVDHGGDINGRASLIATDPHSLAYTPLQSALMFAGDNPGLAKAYIELGADPKLRDGAGRSSLAYCFSIRSFKLIMAYGLDPKEKMPGGGTLLHSLATIWHPPRANFSDEIAFLDFLIGLGIDINARDDEGRTLLHLAAARESRDEDAANYMLLLARGADKSINDKDGKRAVDLLAKSLKKVRAVLQ